MGYFSNQNTIPENFAEILLLTNGVKDYIYENFDAFKLLVCRSDGTKYQDFLRADKNGGIIQRAVCPIHAI